MEIGLHLRRKGILSLKVVLKLGLEDTTTALARGEDESAKEGVWDFRASTARCFYLTSQLLLLYFNCLFVLLPFWTKFLKGKDRASYLYICVFVLCAGTGLAYVSSRQMFAERRLTSIEERSRIKLQLR